MEGHALTQRDFLSVATAIMEAASTGTSGDGIVAILPVDRLYHIHSRREAKPDDI